MNMANKKGGVDAYIFWIFVGMILGIWVSLTFLKGILC